MQENARANTRGLERFLKPLHVNPLFPQELRPLSQAFQVFSFSFADPPLTDSQHDIQVPRLKMSSANNDFLTCKSFQLLACDTSCIQV